MCDDYLDQLPRFEFYSFGLQALPNIFFDFILRFSSIRIMAAFEIGLFVVRQKPDCVRRPRGRCRRAGGRPPVYGLIISKMLRKQFLGEVLKGSRIEPGDSFPDFNFSAHQSCTLLRFLWQSKRPWLKAASNRHGKLDDMTYATLARRRSSIGKQFRLRLTRHSLSCTP